MKSARRIVAGERMDRARENPAAGRLVDAAELLDRLRGERDLVPAELAPARVPKQLVHPVLDGVSLVERGRRQIAPQSLEARLLPMRLENVPGNPLDPRLLDHRPVLPSAHRGRRVSRGSRQVTTAPASALRGREPC